MPSCHITWQLYHTNGNEIFSAINDSLICVVTSVHMICQVSGVLFVSQLINW